MGEILFLMFNLAVICLCLFCFKVGYDMYGPKKFTKYFGGGLLLILAGAIIAVPIYAGYVLLSMMLGIQYMGIYFLVILTVLCSLVISAHIH